VQGAVSQIVGYISVDSKVILKLSELLIDEFLLDFFEGAGCRISRLLCMRGSGGGFCSSALDSVNATTHSGKEEFAWDQEQHNNSGVSEQIAPPLID
jgi:hypothetical protein